MKTITVVIDDDGNASIQVDGIKGRSCTTLTNKLVSSLTDDRSKVKVKLCQDYYLNGQLHAGQAPIKMHFDF